MHFLKITEIPFFILCAGEGSRMKSSGGKMIKSLIPISKKLPGSLELNIVALNQIKVKYIAVALGYEINRISEHIESISNIRVPLKIIDANPDWKKGPVYSFLSGMNNLISEILFALLPGDTVFHPKVFDLLQNTTFDQDHCYLLYYRSIKPKENDIIIITDKKEQNRVIRLAPYQKHIEELKINFINEDSSDYYKVMIPLVLINGSFFLYVQAGLESCGYAKNKVIDFLIPYVNSTGKFKAIGFSDTSPCFVDLDTMKDFERVKSIIN